MKLLTSLTLAASAAIALTACGGGGSDGIGDALNLSSPSARIVNVDPTAPALVLYRNGAQQTDAGAPAYEESSKYFETVDTSSAWTVNDATTGTTLGSASIDMDGSTRYTILAFPGTSSEVDLITVSDPYDISITNDNGRVRVVNGSPNSDTFDVYLTAPGADITTASPTLAGVSYQNAMPASGANSYSLGAGTYEIRLTLTGTKTVFFDSSLTAGSNDDLLLVTLPNSDVPGDVKILDIPSASDQQNSEILNQL